MAARIKTSELASLAPHLRQKIDEALRRQGELPIELPQPRGNTRQNPAAMKGSIFVMICISLGILGIMMLLGLGHGGGGMHVSSHLGLIRN